MKRNAQLFAAGLSAALVTVALAACDRTNDPTRPTMGSSSTSTTDTGVARNDSPGPTGGATDTNTTLDSRSVAAAPGSTIESNPPSAGNPSGGQLSAADRTFIRQAAEDGMYEAAAARVAVERASDPAVKSFASMLVDHHTTANEKLRQVASAHNVQLPTTIPQDKQQVIDRLSKASGQDFDKQFVQRVGIQDHQADISKFEQASRTAQHPQVKDFAQSTLPTLRGHLSDAQKLPVPRG